LEIVRVTQKYYLLGIKIRFDLLRLLNITYYLCFIIIIINLV